MTDSVNQLACPRCGSTYTRTVEFCGLDGTRLVASAEDPLLGRVIDRYQIVELLGFGGMARVYRAIHQYLGTEFAVKVLLGEIASDQNLVRRFHREARALCQIEHEHVVHVVDFGTTSRGLPFMVMELVRGPSLWTAFRREGPFAPWRAARLGRQIAAGLAAAHDLGFVHRDLKPGNVMLAPSPAGEVAKILDFGLVRLLEEDPCSVELTQQGQLFGTPTYMAPEQAAGGEAIPASDLYALGVILYQLLTGKAPFTGDVKQLAFHHIQTPPPALGDDFGGLGPIVLRLLAKDPARRAASAAALIAQLDALALPPVQRPAQQRSAAPAGEPTRKERASPLSQPILQEERLFLGSLGGDEELEHAMRSALGRRRRGPWLALGFVGAMAAGAATVYFGGVRLEELLPSRISAQPREAPAPGAPRREATDAPEALAAAEAPRPSPDERAPTGAAPQEAPQPQSVAAAPPPSNPSDEGPDDPSEAGSGAGPPLALLPLEDSRGPVGPASPTPGHEGSSAPEARPEVPAAEEAPKAAPSEAAPKPAPPTAVADSSPAPQPPGSGPADPNKPEARRERSDRSRVNPVPRAASPLPELESPERLALRIREMHRQLEGTIARRGLSWSDVAVEAPTHAANWSRWVRREGEPPLKLAELTFDTLLGTAEGLEIDRPFLFAKLGRIRKLLGDLGTPRDARGEALDLRLEALSEEARQSPPPRPLPELAADLTLLEADARAAVTAARWSRAERRDAGRAEPRPRAPAPAQDHGEAPEEDLIDPGSDDLPSLERAARP